MGALLQFLLKEHGGKTMTVSLSTVGLVMWVATSLGWEPPIPATRSYVSEAIATGTKGLDFLVAREIEADVDLAAYEVNCMRETWKQGQLSRLKEQYLELVGTPYAEKPCDELERRAQRLQGQAR